MDQIILSISQLNQLLNDGLSEIFPQLEFQGEISELTAAASGHIYLTLKDDNASMSCAIWKSFFYNSSYKPQKGDLVRCTGKPSVYTRNGRLQIIIDKIEPLGTGTLEEQFQQLKIKLEKEGLFSLERKRELTKFPSKIGIITSAKGAALQDILVRIAARNPGLNIDIYDSLVQGDLAVNQILKGISFFNRNPVDFIIIARGGGSLSDLWCFNSEILVRGIFASDIPIVSAVGHEVDITLCDLVADIRVPTPTAAAEILIPSVAEIRINLELANKSLNKVKDIIQKFLQDLDYFNKQIDQKINNYFEVKKLKLLEISSRMSNFIPVINKYSNDVRFKSEVLNTLISKYFNNLRNKINLSAQKLEFLSPEFILHRGYSMVRKGSFLVRSTADLKVGDQIEIQLSDGKIFAQVKDDK